MGCQQSTHATVDTDDECDGSDLSYFSTANILRAALAAAVETRDASLTHAILTRKPEYIHLKIGDVSLVHSNCTDARRETLRVLLSHGASADDGLIDGLSALHLAVMANQVQAVEVLLEYGASVNAPMRIPGQPLDGMTPMHLAARRGFYEIARVLLSSPTIDLSTVDSNGLTPLQLAASRPVGFPVFCLLHAACGVENLRSLDDKSGVPLLVLAVRPDNLATIEYLLRHADGERSVNLPTRGTGETPLMVASAEGLVDVVSMLIAYGGNVNAVRTSEPVDSTALFEAAYHGHHEVLEVLLRAHARHDIFVGQNGMTPLHAACHRGYVACIEQLCEAGANVNQASQSHDQLTPTHLAAIGGYCDTLDVLVKYDAHVDAPSAAGETPLLLAARLGQTKFVMHLLDECHVDILHEDVEGLTALHKAAMMGHAATIEVLLERGMDVNAAQHKTGQTPLHFAVRQGHVTAAEVLIAAGADADLTNADAVTTIELAQACGLPKMIALLARPQSARTPFAEAA